METLSPYMALIDLASNEPLPRSYEAGTIAAIGCDTARLPSAGQLGDDLRLFLKYYDDALRVRDELRVTSPDKISTTKQAKQPVASRPEFKPKNADDYLQHLPERTLLKSRRHEKVVKLYGEFLAAQGFTPSTNVHPQDMTADREGEHWLIEVKVDYNGNGVAATREAFAPLFMYEAFLYPVGTNVRKLAVVSEPIGDLNVEFLERHGIASAWSHGKDWVGSQTAVSKGLALMSAAQTPR